MQISHVFVRRPIFATVLSLVVLILGGLAYFALPVAQYPEVAPPTIVVTASYPGATPETIADTVATPLEQEINGVEDMLYMTSSSTVDGTMSLTITFKLGTDLDEAQVLVQNRVAIAEPRLPAEVRQIGVTTRKESPDLLMVVHMVSPDESRGQLYLSNYVYLQLRDQLARIDGVGNVNVFGARQYSMRVWLDIERLAVLDMTAGDVLEALRGQNIQVAAGTIGQPPLEAPPSFQLSVSTQGRLRTPDEFDEIILRSGEGGRLVRLRDVARVELGAQDYSVNSYLDNENAVALVIAQRPGSNAVDTAAAIKAAMTRMKESFPPGIDYRIVYNPTDFVEESISEVFETLLISALLVVLTIFVFLQGWRPTVIPVVAIPVSLVGTFGIMSLIGFSLNNLSLFGLVLAIGIVVDDAIVVVENVERLIDEGLEARQASIQAMDEVGSALIATTLVLIAVFVPTAFIPGISGQFYRQFALTIAGATAISTFVSLTLSPALCAILMKGRLDASSAVTLTIKATSGWFFRLFDRALERATSAYVWLVERTLRAWLLALLIFVALVVATVFAYRAVPQGFIPPQDQGYLIVAIQLPDGSSLDRTDAVVRKVSEIALETPGIRNAVAFAGFSGATRSNSTSAAAVFTAMEDARERAERGLTVDVVLADLRGRLGQLAEAQIFVLSPPPVRGIGTGGGFKMMVQDRGGVGLAALEQATSGLAGPANEEPGLVQVFSTFRSGSPQLYLDVAREKVRMLDVPIASVFEALQVYLGSVYVNDFNFLGRTYRVTAQAEGEFRDEEQDILRLRARNRAGQTVPLGSVLTVERRTAPERVVRYNLYPAADINGDTLPGTSTGQALEIMERLAAEKLPPGISYEWTDLAFQEKAAGGTAQYIFPLCVLLAFLALAAQYESWLLPLAVILIVPLCVLFALAGIHLRGMDNNILTQIGFVVLIGLACKNAILIVEFAKAEEDKGLDRFAAAVAACRLRLRPILMTAFSFVLGVIPLLVATGAGSEMRRALGTAVFSGMIGVTIVGLFLTPVFYYVLRWFSRDSRAQAPQPAAAASQPAAEASADAPQDEGGEPPKPE